MNLETNQVSQAYRREGKVDVGNSKEFTQLTNQTDYGCIAPSICVNQI